jgi:hypothetical protein
MKKLILLSLLSFSTLAADFTEDRTYYCTETNAAEMEGSQVKAIRPRKFTLSYKDETLSLKSQGYEDIVWVHDPLDEWSPTSIVTNLYYLSAARANDTFYLQGTVDSGEVLFRHYKTLLESSIFREQQMSNGTCTLF